MVRKVFSDVNPFLQRSDPVGQLRKLDSSPERQGTFAPVSERTRIALESVVVASKEQLASSIGGETVILGLQSGRYYGVDGVSARVWQIIQEPSRVLDICNAIVSEYEVDPQVCAADVLALLNQMADGRLIEVNPARDS
jgi:hypothetical protein